MLLPLKEGGVVDIDWLNLMVGHGVRDPLMASSAYTVGKPIWAIIHGGVAAVKQGNQEVLKSGVEKGLRTAGGHFRAFGNPSEAVALKLMGERENWEWTYPEILHPDLVRQAEEALEAERVLRAAKRKSADDR